MQITIENNEKLKLGDIGDKFTITLSDNPPEFTFNADTKCRFIAKHRSNSAADFTGECTVTPASKSASYVSVSGNNSALGYYDFEFEFYTDPASYIQTYPKDSSLNYEVIEDFN